jgi:hypothetical protein
MRRRHRILVAATMLAPACAPTAAHRSTSSAPPPTAGHRPVDQGAAAARPDEEAAASPAGPSTTMTEAPAPSTTVTVTVPTTTTHTHAPVTTTFVLPETAEDDLSDEEWWQAQPGYGLSTRDALLACIRSYEQNDDPRQGPTGYASDTGNGYYGAYQFTLGTWASVGGTGNPAHASPAEQDARAWALYLSRGLQPWPTPSRRCAG